jgi:hypothetical protein
MKFALCTLTFAAIPALALNQISWVASSGTDGNPCTRTSPCATFQHAHDVTSANGIVKAIDAADYGLVNITKGITLDGNGTGAEISVGFAATGIIVNGVAADQVNISNLAINVLSGGSIGIRANSNTNIENVTIAGTPYTGVLITYATFVPKVVAKNLVVSGGDSFGVEVMGGSLALRESVITNSSNYGVYVTGDGAGHGGAALIERSEISFNLLGFAVDGGGGGGVARLSDSVITGNGIGISTTNSGQIITFRTNMLAGNTTDGSTPFSISLK